MNYGKLTAGTTKTAIDTAKPSEKGEIITYLSRMGDVLYHVFQGKHYAAVKVIQVGGIKLIRDGDKPHIMYGKILLNIITGVYEIAPKPRQILYDHAVNMSRLNVREHLLKCRAPERGSGKAVVDIGVIDLKFRLVRNIDHTTILKNFYGMTDTRLRYAHMRCHIHRSHHAVLLFQYIDGFQIALARSVEFHYELPVLQQSSFLKVLFQNTCGNNCAKEAGYNR